MGKLIIIVIIALVIGGYIIKSAYDLDLSKRDDQKSFLVKFLGWIRHLGSNVKDIAGLVIKETWVPDTNSTNVTKVRVNETT